MTSKVAEPGRNSAHGSDKIKKIRDLRGGVETMRAAGTTYLPMEEKEKQADYEDRLKRSWLFPALDQAVSDAADTVFRKEIAFGDDVPAEIEALEENITNEGRNLNNFVRDVFEDGLEAGVCGILVDMPAQEGTPTRQDVIDRNIRPYWSHVRAEDILGWKVETINNQSVLTQLRLLESDLIDDPKNEFEQEQVPQIRVINRDDAGMVSITLYQKNQGDWQIVGDPVVSGLDAITFVPFYTERTGFLTADPPFETLADLNIAHWQSASDQRNILHSVRVPMLFMKGMAAKDVTASPNNALVAESPQADAKWLEHNGSAIDAGRQDLLDLEQRMHQVGLQIVTRPVGNTSATESDNNRAKETTALAQWANNLKETIEKALQFSADYMGLDSGGSVDVNTDFRSTVASNAELQFLLTARNTGQLSPQTFLKEAKRRNVLMDDLDVDDEIERIGPQEVEPFSGDLLDLTAEELEPADDGIAKLEGALRRLEAAVS